MSINLFNGSYGDKRFCLNWQEVEKNYPTFRPCLYPSVNSAEKIITYKSGCDSLSLILPPLDDIIDQAIDRDCLSDINKSQKGVYFLIEDGYIEYVGKAIDLKSRVGSHINSTSSQNRYTDSISFISLNFATEALIKEIEATYIFSVKSERNKTLPTYKRFATLEHIIERIGCQITVLWWYMQEKGIRGWEMEYQTVYDSMEFIELCEMIKPFDMYARRRMTVSKIINYWDSINMPTIDNEAFKPVGEDDLPF